MSDIRVITDGLRFPEGPIALPNGDVILVEIAAGQLTRVAPDGTKTTVAEPGGGPNGAAIGPDGPARQEAGRLICAPGGHQMYDSLAVDGAGNVCVATIHNGGITVVAPDGFKSEHVPMPDHATTYICFGGPDLRTAYITLSSTGRLVAMEWQRPGLPLNFLNA